MAKVLSSLGEVVDFGKLKIQYDIEEAKKNPVTASVPGRVSTLDPNKLGMGLTPPIVKEGLVTLTSDETVVPSRKIQR